MKRIIHILVLLTFLFPTYSFADGVMARDFRHDNQYWPLLGDGSKENPYVSAASLTELISLFKIGSYSYVDKFGENENVAIGPEDIWEFGGEYIYDTTAAIISISSSNDIDTQDIEIQGLDINYNLVTYTITLDGQTRVELTTPLLRFFRGQNANGTPFLGTIYIYTGTTNTLGVPADANVRGIITAPNQQTQMAMYTVPRGKVGFLYRGELGMLWSGAFRDGVESAKLQYKSRRIGEVFKVKKTIGLMTHGNSNYQDKRTFPDIIPSGIDLKLTAYETSTEMGFVASFDLLLVDETEFSPEFLSAIGQLGY